MIREHSSRVQVLGPWPGPQGMVPPGCQDVSQEHRNQPWATVNEAEMPSGSAGSGWGVGMEGAEEGAAEGRHHVRQKGQGLSVPQEGSGDVPTWQSRGECAGERAESRAPGPGHWPGQVEGGAATTRAAGDLMLGPLR